MERENDWDSDFCDLEPGKICDNCCRCLDMNRDYNEIEASLLRTDEIVSIGDWDAEADAYYFEAWEDAEEPEHEEIQPIQIDPALMAEWEARLRAYEAEQRLTYMRSLHGIRKRRQSLQHDDPGDNK